VAGSAEEADTVTVQAASVQLDKEHIALYKGNREFQAITVEHYSAGICQLTSPHMHAHPDMRGGWQGDERSGGKVRNSMRGNWCRLFVVRCPSCHQPVLKASFLQPPTVS